MSRTRTRLQVPERANVMEIRKELMDKYGYDYDSANDVLYYTADHYKTNGGKASEWKVPDADGYITVRYYGLSRFSVEDHREFPRKRVAIPRPTEYNRMDKGLPVKGHERGRTYMPPARGRRAATAPPPPAEPANNGNGEVDFQRYLDKDISPTMQDYVTWFEDNVGSLDDIPVDKILTVGVSVYNHFQRSDFNQDRREERRAARASARPAPEPEPEPAKPAAKGRGGRRAAAPAPEPEPEPAPARRGRGRAARAGAEAPY